MQVSRLSSLMLAGAVATVAVVVPHGGFSTTVSHSIDLPEKSIRVHNFPNTVIHEIVAREPPAATSTTSTNWVTVTLETDTVQITTTIGTEMAPYYPSEIQTDVSAVTTTETVPIVTSTLPSAAVASPAPSQPFSCDSSICQATITDSLLSANFVAVWSVDNPAIETYYSIHIASESTLTETHSKPFTASTEMASGSSSSVVPSWASETLSSSSDSIVHMSTTIPWMGSSSGTDISISVSGASTNNPVIPVPTSISSPDSVVIPGTPTGSATETLNTNPAPSITSINDLTTITNANGTTIIPVTAISSAVSSYTGLNETSIKTSYSYTTTNIDVTALTTASTTGTFGQTNEPSKSGTTTSTASASSDTQNSEGGVVYQGYPKNKLAMCLVVAAVVNFGFAVLL